MELQEGSTDITANGSSSSQFRGMAYPRLRRIDSEEIFEFEVSDDKIKVVYILPGFAYNIISLSKSEDWLQ